MPMLALVIPFLKTWWKVILPIVLLLAALGYVKILHMEIDHYKEKVVTLELAIDKANKQQKQLEDNAVVLTNRYKESLSNQFKLQEAQGQVIHERIKKNEESKRIVISDDIISLFNDSKPRIKLKIPADTIKGDDARTTSITNNSKPPTGEEASTLAYEHTLNELLDISAYNDANHVKCIATVKEWQSFWTDYESTYKAVANAP